MSISQTITDFATLAIQAGGWMELDRLYLQNRMAAAIGETALEKTTIVQTPPDALTLVDQLVQQAVKNQVISNQEPAAMEQLKVQLLDFLTPPPSVVNAFFAQHYAKKPEEATDYFYQLSKNNQAIKTFATTEHHFFTTSTTYGALQFLLCDKTFDQGLQRLAAASQSTTKAYPNCPLCLANEGYKGRSDYPASTNQRVIRMNLDGESWGFSYAPYELYEEQALIASEAHEKLVLTATTFAQLLKITEILPHYFVGAQADLSSLHGELFTHKHYQAGKQAFPLAAAEIETYVELPGYPLTNAGIVKWPMATIRLEGPNADELVAAADQIVTKWCSYSDETAGIRATTDNGQPSHSITAIARKKDLLFQLDLVLRDANAVNHYQADQIPLATSIDASHQQKIGLLNVMGFFPLANAIKKEYDETLRCLLQQPNHLAEPTRLWADQLIQPSQTKTSSEKLLQTALGQLFLEKLAAASAFKPSETGKSAFQRFILSL